MKNKIYFISSIVVMLLSVQGITTYAQPNIQYSYYNAGNHIMRQYNAMV